MAGILSLIGRFLFEKHDAIRMRKQHPDGTSLDIRRDISYLADGDRGHLLDIYRPRGVSGPLPWIVNIHGGGLVASYKEVNTGFNYAWARLGYAVVSISYRRIPETTLIHQIRDVVAALHFIGAHGREWGLDLERGYLTGDSAGALLGLFALSLQGSPRLREAFGTAAPGFRFRAAGLISIMLDTRRRDVAALILGGICSREDRGRAYEPFLLDPASLVGTAALPPLFLVTSAQDLIRRDTLKLSRLLDAAGVEHVLLDAPKGTRRRLEHVFAVQYPDWHESREVFDRMDAFFRACL